MSAAAPTPTELLLALEVRDLAIRRRLNEIEAAAAKHQLGYDHMESKWTKSFDDYVREVTDEIGGIWETVSERLKSKAQ